MIIRHYHEGDAARLKELHTLMGMDYVFPNFNHPEFFSRLVVADDEGKISMAIMGRLSAEMYLLLDPEAGTARERFENFLTLHLMSESDMRSKGIEDSFAQIPPQMDKFKRLLSLLGWVAEGRGGWSHWTKAQLERVPQLPEKLQLLLERKGEQSCFKTQSP